MAGDVSINLRLYTCEASRGFRVSWAAAELGIDLPTTMLVFPPRAHDKSYFAVNPLGTVPALVLENGETMTESCGIVHYLSTRFGAGTLAVGPDEPDYPLWLDYCYHADATLTFPQTVRLRFSVFEKARGLEAAGDAYGVWFGKRLARIDARLQTREFLCAERFTAADVCVGYALHLSTSTGLAHLLTPRLAEWLAELRARPGFQAAVTREAVLAVEQGVRTA